MERIKLFLLKNPKNKGQSFMELIVVFAVILLLLMGVVEFGNLLNQYISLVDGVREGARYGSTISPFPEDSSGNINYNTVQDSFYQYIDFVVEGYGTPQEPGAINPIILDRDTDQILITFLSVRHDPIDNSVKYVTYGPHAVIDNGRHTASNITDQFIQNSLQSKAPNTGILIVEIFYDYKQLLKLPVFTVLVPDPIPVHTYAVMPLPAAEPTP